VTFIVKYEHLISKMDKDKSEILDESKSDEIKNNLNHQVNGENHVKKETNDRSKNNSERRHDEPSELSFEICELIAKCFFVFVVVFFDR
jgi:hypothetical protein